jgi:hypothetical protein
MVKLLAMGVVNASDYATEILSDVVRWRNSEPGTAGQKLIIPSNEARPDTARPTQDSIKAYRMERVPYPPSSPEPTPSDCHLFDCLKNKLQDNLSRMETNISMPL